MAILQEPLKGDEDVQGPSWQSELSFREWKAELEAARANWASAPSALKSTLLLHGNDLTAATSWLISRPRDLTPQQQSFIRKSIARSYNTAAEEHRQQDAERKKRLKSWISFGATISAFVLFLGLELALYDLWVKVSGATYVTHDMPPTFTIPRMPDRPAEATQMLPVPTAAEPASEREPMAAPIFERPAEMAPSSPRQASLTAIAERALDEARRDDPVRAHLIALEALSESDPREPIDVGLLPALTALRRSQMQVRTLPRDGDEGELANAIVNRDGKTVLLTASDHSVRWISLDNDESRKGGEGLAMAAPSIGQPIVAHDESSFAVPGGDDSLRLWPAGASRPVATLRGHEAGITALAMSRDRLKVATTSWDETIRMWDAHTGRNRLVLRGHRGPALAAAFSADGRRLVTAGEDRTARVWNVADGAEVAVLSGHESTVQTAAFDPAGTRVLTTSLDGTARLWDPTTGRETAVLRHATGPVHAAAFGGAADEVATLTARGELTVWNAADGTTRSFHPNRGYTVRSFALGGDNLLLIVTGAGVALLKDSMTGDGHGVLEAPDGDRIASAAFTADGRHVVAVTLRRRVLTWPIPVRRDALIAHLRASAPRCLSLTERSELLLDVAIPRWCTDMGKPTGSNR